MGGDSHFVALVASNQMPNKPAPMIATANIGPNELSVNVLPASTSTGNAHFRRNCRIAHRLNLLVSEVIHVHAAGMIRVKEELYVYILLP